MVIELGGHFNFCSVICFFHLFYFFFSFLKTIITSTSSTHSRYFNFNTTINTLNCFCTFFQKLYQSAMTLYRTWTKRLNYFGNTPFLFSCIHLTKSPQTLVKWAFQDTIKNSLHTFLPYFKHFLKIFVIHSVDLCHIKPLIIVLYSHLFYGLNVVLPFDYLV